MLLKIYSIIGCCAWLLCSLAVFPQDVHLDAVLQRTEAVQSKMQKTTTEYLTRLQKLEDKLKERLAIHHPVEAAEIFGDAQRYYADQLSRLGKNGNAIPFGNVYSEQLDSLSTAVKFLDRTTSLPALREKLQPVTAVVAKAQGNLNQSMAVSQFLQERQKFLQDKLRQFGMTGQLSRFKQQALRYREEAAQYKALLEDPKALGAKALDHVKQLPAFRQFFSNHSQLASLFVLPGAKDPDVGKNAVTGLQTRAVLEKEVQAKYGKSASLQMMIADNTQKTTQPTPAAGLPAVPAGLMGLVAANNDGADPSHIPSFRKRWEWGLNVQTLPSNGYWPARTDIGLTAGYKVSESHTAGIETAFRMGWGKDWQHLALTGQGAGARAYWESRLKSSFWLTAGIGLNYQCAGEGHLQPVTYNPWQKTLGAGVVKKYRIGSKMKGNVQLLYDIFHDTHIPATPSWIFKVGYGF